MSQAASKPSKGLWMRNYAVDLDLELPSFHPPCALRNMHMGKCLTSPACLGQFWGSMGFFLNLFRSYSGFTFLFGLGSPFSQILWPYVLLFAGVELIFFLVASMGLCFGFVMETALIIQERFNDC